MLSEDNLIKEFAHQCEHIIAVEITEPGGNWTITWMEHTEVTTGHANDRWGMITREVMQDINDWADGETLDNLRKKLTSLQDRGAWDVIIDIPEDMAHHAIGVMA
ncbi:hypothetical protein [Corynebacterium sp. A21]|uniref:hypothetical protein n=1 Tax=Corynebacterium sp. A21 TaxID=3457318 RepID=UPI003FD222E2